MYGFVRLGKPEYAVYLLGLLICIAAMAAFYRNRKISTIPAAALFFGLILLFSPGWQGVNLMQLLPVAIYIALAMLLGHSLKKGQIPLITLLAKVMRGGHMPEPVAAYTHKVTIVWFLFFCMLAATALWLALFASLENWSLFANLLSYLLIACLMMGEYVIRRWHLGDLVDYGFADYVRGLFRLDYGQLFRHK